MARKRRRSQLEAITEINMTPLLDLTFLLLIVFMMTMPLLEYGTSVKPPELNAAALPEQEFCNLSLKADGSLEYQKQSITREELIPLLQGLKSSSPDTVLLLRGDGGCTYDMVITLMKDIKNSGFTNISLVTQGERSGK